MVVWSIVERREVCVRTNAAESDCPVWVPEPAELSDVELLLDGAFPALDGFLGAEDAESVRTAGRLADGSPWPVPITLRVPDEIAAHPRVELRDQEGAPLAVVENIAPWRDERYAHLAGPVRAVTAERSRLLRMLRPPADVVRAGLPPGPVLGVVPDEPLDRARLAQIRHAAGELGATVLLLPRLTGPRPETLVRATFAAQAELPEGTAVVPVPLTSHGDGKQDDLLAAHVAAAYGATHLLGDRSMEHVPVTVVEPPEVARGAGDRWLPAALVPAGERRPGLSDDELQQLLDSGTPLPEWFATAPIAEEWARLRPPLHERGFTVLFTGLSGAGKSTLASALRDELARLDRRQVTLLDGDVVRRSLCAGLGFSPEDRSRNVRRIGWVAAEITRHGGAAICAPIAPYAADRDDVRRRVREVGEFALVHVATPLDECERRDRKGLYARAREGSLPEFTGVSAPYEEPEDADLVLDTSRMSVSEAVAEVVALLGARGWVRSWTSG
ncbi:bifunctional sulfate adenylyltransferase/adenylylsulfate kinase [Saccharopolyspora taberi]|uniref:Adenylyl-sulfate kinase n=2 Tax=Saccharopolyspora taberi TaxID=60895 RepID=A0ABN3VDE9_9PSEU